MNYEEAKAFKQKLNEILDAANTEIRKFNKYANDMGLVPDHIRETPEYQEVKKEFNRAFAALRTFNGWMNKQFKKEIKKDQRELVKSRYKKAQ